jgi:hypothetical protein
MQEKEKNVSKFHFEQIKPIELERILRLYGITKKEYCDLHRKSKSWFYNVFRAKRFLTCLDIKALTDKIGTDMFYKLLEDVRQQYPPKIKK